MKTLSDLIRRKSELQIAPLIDVVFLLLIYFMVTSSLVRKEADLSFQLPGPTSHLPGYPIEVLVEISAPGDVLIEGSAFTDMEALSSRLASLKASADLSGSEVIVSIQPADKARHGRIVDVMDACASARIDNLSFCM